VIEERKVDGPDMVPYTELDRKVLEAMKFSLYTAMAKYDVQHGNMRLMVENAADRMGFTISTTIYGEKVESRHVTYPTTWLDAFKLRWFPKWALERWPANQTTFGFDARILYPRFETPATGPGYRYVEFTTLMGQK